MKKISITLFAAILFIATAFKASAQNEQTRQVSGFNGIAGSSSFNIHVKVDGTESLKIVAEDKIINDIQTEVKDGILKIGFKNSFSWHINTGKVDVYVTAKSLSSLSNSGSGSIKVEGSLNGNSVGLHLSGSGSIKVDGEVTGNNVEARVSSSGNITANVKAGNLQAHISGSGSISITGSASDTELHVSGSGSFRGRELKTGTLNAQLSGSGGANVDVEKSISAHISGSGSLGYTGTATISDIRTSGSGRVRKGE